ncbi:ThiF family adenylyltransferase [Arthrobacter sp. NQ7]|uniref:ThiF family adenylyltransferase n=1 Tax=Arthrobacter sp. NQ7 TaxID=3032303 RepID=UPI00240F47AF|nr:ThiF family adenylyltransferase [Arthrobacter sp. NQ7]MDJ0458571.1 ThiF family adenylyltransferase [Arthrobacter sp. NQ7]
MSASRTVLEHADLTQLVNEGYAVRIIAGHLVIDDMPFVTAEKTVQRGSLLCPLDRDGNGGPGSHVMWFHGGQPCDRDGQPLAGINGGVQGIAPAPDMVSSCAFSLKPPSGYASFYEKVSLYSTIVAGPAQAIDPEVTPFTFRPITTDEEESVFRYLDTFSSRARITEFTRRLAVGKVVIVGAGGTGSYLLDLLAKTPIRELHVYDGDVFATHNAFRAPGAADIADLDARVKKVDYFAGIYGRMRRHIHPHPVPVTASNLSELLDADFVFLAMDPSPDKTAIVETLEAHGLPFIDTGIGVGITPGGIGGLIRVTTGHDGHFDHIQRTGVLANDENDDADYNTNIQVSELNMMAAAMAVLQFKQHLGFYADDEKELHTLYSIEDNALGHRFGQSEVAATVPGGLDGHAGLGIPEANAELTESEDRVA